MRFFILCLILVAFVAYGQQKQDKKAKKPKKEPKKQEQTVAVADEKELDMPEEGSDYIYKPRGRRDPFWDLLRGKSAKQKRETKEGIAGLEIEQLELEGILFKRGEYIALFKGPDSKPYDVKVGQSVYDGEIIKIDAESVVFKKILTIALGGTKEKTIIKRLNPEEEKE